MTCDCKASREADVPATHIENPHLINADGMNSDSDTDEELPNLMDVDESDSDYDNFSGDLLSGTASSGKDFNPCKILFEQFTSVFYFPS